MKNKEIYKKFSDFINKYKEYFLLNDELWINNLKLLEKYIIENKKTPSTIDKNKDIKQLGSWLSTQQKNYKNKDNIMKDENIRKQWSEFIDKYKEYFKKNLNKN